QTVKNLEIKTEWASKLAGAIQIPTVSRDNDDLSLEELSNLHLYLKTTFPDVFSSSFVEVTAVNEHSLLLSVSGSQITKNPYLLAAHLDVVPAGDLDRWDHPPFQDQIISEEGVEYVFGRGALDDKHSVIGILQALEEILKDGGRPKRSFYIGFGHDEEVGGEQGAANIALELQTILEEQQQTLDFILDEGMYVTQGLVPGVDSPVIYIGVVEKGSATIELSVDGVQGHSSIPPRESAIGILSAGVAHLEQNRHPAYFSQGPEYDTMEYLAPHASFLYKLIFSNLWLLSGALSSFLAGDSTTDALQRTTTAVTMFNAGIKENVMPSIAKATVNHRIHPTSNLEDVLVHDTNVIHDARIKIKVLDYFPPPRISPYSDDSLPFQTIAGAALQVFPDGNITPGTLVANTDTKHYLNFTENIYRFTPSFVRKTDVSRFHGFNERISVDNFAQVVQFYFTLMTNADFLVEPKEEGSGLDAVEELEGSAELKAEETEEEGEDEKEETGEEEEDEKEETGEEEEDEKEETREEEEKQDSEFQDYDVVNSDV
ncbi:N-fatty-acyl-amino acid synthase/hydrolase PM20D1.1, partial [Eurytemora carolleeae]|uniref:N-fatty-acyl-amino acid synthase/hydrolase PM20D1.1 n=1 Tax=Eurytemora carolleeae TaxID=1294199 RepID=UPI000C77DD94